MQKKYRLTKSRNIINTIHSKSHFFSNVVNIFYKKNNIKVPQIAIVVSKKKFHLAITRNKIKRQIRSIVIEDIKKIGNYNIVIIVKSNWLQNSFQENKIILQKLLSKIFDKKEQNLWHQ